MTSPAPDGVLVCVGDLVEDIVIWPRIGSDVTGPDVITVVGTDNPATVTRSRGGSAANVAAFAARSVAARFIGRVGDDHVGRSMVDALVGAGVDCRVQRAGRTGTIVVQVHGSGERTMFPDRGAAAELAAVPLEWVDGAAVLHVSGYTLASRAGERAVIDLVRRARAGGAVISVDAASVNLLQAMAHRFDPLLEELRPDVLFANADEAALIEIRAVTDRGGTYVIKNGADPVCVHGPERPPLLVPVEPVTAVLDTTGAGDAFAAGFLSSTIRGSSLTEAVRAGNLMAAAVLGQPGATLSDQDAPAGHHQRPPAVTTTPRN